MTGNISYYFKAYDVTGRDFNTTLYHIAVANFALQPQTNTLTVYRTKSATFQLHLLSCNNFTEQVLLSSTGNGGVHPHFLQEGFVNLVSAASVSGLPNGATYILLTATNRTVLAGGPGTTDLPLQIKIAAHSNTGTSDFDCGFGRWGHPLADNPNHIIVIRAKYD